MAIQSAERVLRTKMGVDSLFCPWTSCRVLTIKVFTQLMEGPKRRIFLAMAIDAHIVSALRMEPESSL